MTMKTKLMIAGTGNIIDAVATYILTQYYGFIELNPFMALLLQYPIFAVVSKIVVVTSILLFIYHTKRTRYVDALATFAATIYGSLAIYYIVFFMCLFLR